MVNNVVNKLKIISHSPWYWLLFISGGLTALGIALFYQYYFEDQPCVLCIQIRLWITLLILLSIVGMLCRNKRVINSVMHLSTVLVAAALTERSYQLLGTERGFVFGDCSFNLGLPDWFAIQQWLPSIYRIESSCGYTPELLFGITMAEALMVMSVGMLVLTVGVTWASMLESTDRG